MFTGFSPWLHLVLPHVGTVLGFALALVLVARMQIDKRPVPSAWAWMLAIILIPWIGVPLYLALGGRKLRRRAAEKPKLYRASREDRPMTAVERVLASGGTPPARGDNDCTLLADGTVAFARTLEAIVDARRTIDLATFILAQDRTGDAVLDALAHKARNGVQVRVLVDALFAYRANHRGLAHLRSAGGRVAFFMPLVFRRPFRGHANLRNHRKLLVVDGGFAIAGGMNVAEEYMGPSPLPGRWRDVALAIRGPAVGDVAHVFEKDWAFATSTPSAPPVGGRTSMTTIGAGASSAGRVQVVASGPDAAGDTLYDALLTSIFEAQRRIAIATPYFVPDDTLLRGLFLALRRGVEVTIVVPARSNHRLADLASASALRDLEAAGARVRPFLPGMLHAKVLLVDDRLATVGSANFDMRSLFLDFELALFCTSTAEVVAIEHWFEETLVTCAEGLGSSRPAHRLREGLARLVAPLV
jgi:cardiolipin synthase